MHVPQLETLFKEDSVAMKRIMIIAFIVAALGLAGCSSNEIDKTPTNVDTAPPAVPTQLTGSSWQSQITITWAPNTTDTDFAGFNIYRDTGTRVMSLTNPPLTTNMYRDANPVAGYNTYQVTAVDLSGNESAQATIEVNLQPDYDTYHPDQP